MGSFTRISSRIDIERLPTLPQTSSFQNGDQTDDDLRQGNVDINTKARKDDQDCATKDASPYRTDEKKIIEKKLQ